MREKFELTGYTLHTEKLPHPMTIAHVSDLHEQDPSPVLALLRQVKPDIICVTGDTLERHDWGVDPRHRGEQSVWLRLLHYSVMHLHRFIYYAVGSHSEASSENSYRFFREAVRIAPVFLSLGNHEWYLTEEDTTVLRETGVTLLDNSDLLFDGISIGGLSPDVNDHWLEGFRHKPGFRLLLCHHPEYYEEFHLQDIDLILSGHAHGGQWRIHGKGIYAPDQGLFPPHSKGFYDNCLVVSSGCSNTTAIPRFGNPCEVVVVELLPA